MKREANIQLTQDSQVSDEENVVDSGAFKRASDDIISRRIIKPLKKASATFMQSPASGGSVANGTTAFLAAGSATPGAAPAVASVAASTDDQTAMEIRGLNTSFLYYINKCVKEDCFVDLSRVNLEYNSYLSKIGQTSGNIELGQLPESNQKLPLSLNFGSKPTSKPAPKTDTAFGFHSFNDRVSTFGESNPKATGAPKFDFKKTTETPKFDFTKTTETPKFDFTKTTETPKFDFTKTTETPKFDFTKTTETPKFDFTKTTETPKFDFTKTTETPKFDFTKTPFKATETGNYGPNDQKPPIFGHVSVPTFGINAGLAGTTGLTTTRDVNGEVDDEVVHEEQVGDALMAGKAGEEGEVTLYSVRSKLRKFINGVWEVIGLGLLKVNQNQSTKASRIIMRSEAGKVLLNVSIFSEMPVTLKDTCVNFSASLTAGSLTTLSAKVKEKQDAKSLVDAIEKAKTKN